MDNQNPNVAFHTEDNTVEVKKESQFRLVFKRFLRRKSSVIGGILLIVIILASVFAPVIAPYNYLDQDLYNKNSPSTSEHWLGTDTLGRDTFSRLLYGGRNSLIVGFAATCTSAIIGCIIGLIAGYYGGKLDNVIMRVLDVFQAIPSMMMAITISAVLGTGYINTIIAIAIAGMPMFARMARASCMTEKGSDYVEAAKSINASEKRIIFKHVLPNAASPMIVQFTMRVSGSIMSAASLSFVGLGILPPEAEWGAMVSAGRTYLRTAPMQCIWPAVCIMLVVFSVNMLGDGLRDAMDPKMKN
ncbi:MAG: ABC transporter permease [Oscillospiraceae bacterium]